MIRSFTVIIITDYANLSDGTNQATGMTISWRFSAEAFRRMASKPPVSRIKSNTLQKILLFTTIRRRGHLERSAIGQSQYVLGELRLSVCRDIENDEWG